MSENVSPQSLRLKKFIDETGYSVFEFGKQCGIPSSKTMSDIIVKGKVPSPKVLDKIINRFPQLNHDWVVLGYGEMIVQGMQKQPASSNSLKKSRDASYENIQEYLENHDYALNYLANKVEKAILSATKTFQQVNDRLTVFEEQLVHLQQNQEKFTKSLQSNTEKASADISKNITDLQNNFYKTAKQHLVIVNNLDKKRMKFLREIMFETQNKILEASNTNTQKALKFVSEIGNFKKHSNPKPEK